MVGNNAGANSLYFAMIRRPAVRIAITRARGCLLEYVSRSKTYTRHKKRQKRESVKLKTRPEDFVVEEVTEGFQYGPNWGPYSVYSLTKRTMETQHAIYAMAEEFGVKREDVHFGGLKDKHAITTQYVTIENGPKKSYEQKSFSATYLGDAKRHFHSSDILGNKFKITLRNFADDVIPTMDKAINSRTLYGFPNYYGAQRFGSVGLSGEFAAKLWCAREHERALHLLFTDEYPHEKPSQKQFRAIAADHWGDWNDLKRAANEYVDNIRDVKLHMKVLDNLIRDPQDYLGAFMKFPKHLRAIWLSAYQSFLWNTMASLYLQKFLTNTNFENQFLSPSLTQLGTLAFYQDITEQETVQLKRVLLPMISKRTAIQPQPLLEEVIEETLDMMRVQMDDLVVPSPRDCFFTNISRNLIEFPHSMSHKWIEDESYAGKKSLRMEFQLGRGVYATSFFSALHSYSDYLRKQ